MSNKTTHYLPQISSPLPLFFFYFASVHWDNASCSQQFIIIPLAITHYYQHRDHKIDSHGPMVININEYRGQNRDQLQPCFRVRRIPFYFFPLWSV